MDTSQALRPTHVVTCFLERLDEREPRILIVQRSQRVGSYQGRWAGISGFVEPNVTPDEQALTEISEETGLLPEQAQRFTLNKRAEMQGMHSLSRGVDPRENCLQARKSHLQKKW